MYKSFGYDLSKVVSPESDQGTF